MLGTENRRARHRARAVIAGILLTLCSTVEPATAEAGGTELRDSRPPHTR